MNQISAIIFNYRLPKLAICSFEFIVVSFSLEWMIMKLVRTASADASLILFSLPVTITQ